MTKRGNTYEKRGLLPLEPVDEIPESCRGKVRWTHVSSGRIHHLKYTHTTYRCSECGRRFQITEIESKSMMKGTRKRPFVPGEDMIDLHSPHYVEVDRMGDRLYVHVDGVTVLRIYDTRDVILREDGDERSLGKERTE